MDTIQLWQSNPYQTGWVFTFPNRDIQFYRDPTRYTPAGADAIHVIQEGESLSSIAYDRYGDSKYYWIIQETNKILFALDITIGQSLIIPDLTTFLNTQSE